MSVLEVCHVMEMMIFWGNKKGTGEESATSTLRD
jgi:hypothetical protein